MASELTSPLASPSLAASSETPGSPAFTIDFDGDGHFRLLVFDPFSELAEARETEPREADVVIAALGGDDHVAVQGSSEDIVLVGWVGTICDRIAGLTVRAPNIRLEFAARPGCDAAAVARSAMLRFRTGRDEDRIAFVVIPPTIIRPIESGTPAPPPPGPEG